MLRFEMDELRNALRVACPDFREDGEIPKRHTGFGEDVSPRFSVGGLSEGVRTLAIVMDDMDVPFQGELNHWLIWNLPPEGEIPEHIPHGAECPNGARQGTAYGKPVQGAEAAALHPEGTSVSLSRVRSGLFAGHSGHVPKGGADAGYVRPRAADRGGHRLVSAVRENKGGNVVQARIAGVAFVVIALFLIAKPALVWRMTESWKLEGKRERSEWYDLVLRIVGGTFLVVGVLLAFGIMR